MRGHVICHANLLHSVPEIARACHESYFGPSRDPDRSPEWFTERYTNPIQYLNSAVFDCSLHGEHAVGLRVLYDTVQRHELFELFDQRCREGDFCVLHMTRNPVACLISQKQAQRSGVWSRHPTDLPRGLPMSMSLDAQELTECCRQYAAMQQRLKTMCGDYLEVAYADLLVHFQTTMYRIFDFLELPYASTPAAPGCLRLRNRPVQDRISNFAALRQEVPSEVRSYMDAEDLY